MGVKVLMDPFYLAMAAAVGMLLASVAIYQMSKPRVGVWKCCRCTVEFSGAEDDSCPACFARAPHQWLGRL